MIRQAFGNLRMLPGRRDLHGVVLPLHLHGLGVPVAEAEHLIGRAPRLVNTSHKQSKNVAGDFALVTVVSAPQAHFRF